ncbi:PREDICTED: uncharacterized protein LOC109470381 [Branchiostoma belcheri]|uniref:Uncharacterized protein LOC109470381 n=1 Tax=Branchiostoma belcheri TaxID=7741 RepID=A0A6P4Y759_BRABE|nr:PREDICTED: uncharacterized protein LOC109470381 [Branchiostoma belcheri]
MKNRATWRSMLYLQKSAVRTAATSLQLKFLSQRPLQQVPQQLSQQPSQKVSQQPPEVSPLPWVDFAAPDPTKSSGRQRKITFLCNSFNGLSQRLYLELISRGHHVIVHDNPRGEKMTEVVEADQPDLVVCPFLTRRVPPSLYNNPARPVLIVHPGIPGDEGPSSIDWALKEGATEWGVTVLQAAETMDGGDIWATCKFTINRQATKSSLYGKEVTQAAVVSVLQAIDAWERDVPPIPLDYKHPEVKGELKRKLTAEDRQVDWTQAAEDVARSVRACDSQPGALGVLRLPVQGQYHVQNLDYLRLEHEFALFGACVEGDPDLTRRVKKDQELRVAPGDVIGRRNGAVLVACGEDTAVWISHLKTSPKKTSLKLPATSVLPPADVTPLPINHSDPLPYSTRPKTFQDVWTTRQDGVCYVHFDFYNGAMSTAQCKRLEQNSECAATESWANITAIDDVVKAIFSIRSKVTVAALQGNAGAGGVMMALAADKVWSHAGVVLNPHYRKMALFGSEYWTYSLPRRVGSPAAEELTNELQPLLATKARDKGMIDDVIGYNAEELNAQIPQMCRRLQANSREILREKKSETTSLWSTLEEHRHEELARMWKCFHDEEYHDRRHNFVYH